MLFFQQKSLAHGVPFLARYGTRHDTANSHAGDDIYQPLLRLFSAKEIADLTSAASLVNAFNRLAISMRQ